MALQLLDVGSAPNDGTGDTGRDGGIKINANFTELYTFTPSAALLIDGTASMAANASITFSSDGLNIGPSVTDGVGYPAIESSHTEIQLGSAADKTMYFNYNVGTGLRFGTTANRQAVNWYVVDGYFNGINFDFGSGVQMRYGTGTSNSKKYMRFGAAGLSGVQFFDNLEIALGTESDATLEYDGTDLVINPQAVGSGRVLITDGDLAFSNAARIGWQKYTANSVTVSAGTPGASVVADLQTKDDGNYFHIDEAAATPGMDLIVDFVSVTAFNWVNVSAWYVGSAAHAGVAVQLYNWVSTAWDNHAFLFHHASIGTTAENMIKCDSLIPDDANYIGTGVDAGKVRVRLLHAAGGNPSHDLDVDVVALYQ